MRKSFLLVLFSALLILSACGNTNINPTDDSYTSSTDTKSNSTEYATDSKTYSTFTNKYGTSTTKCVVAGCDNYIATSGDTNCCVAHSNKCLECKAYIDGDAMYCISCIENVASSKSSQSSSKSSNSSSNTCKFKEGGSYVCSSKAVSGSSYCSYHKNYLEDAYDSLFGD